MSEFSKELDQSEYDKLVTFAMRGQEKGTKFAGLSFEDGIMAVIEVIDGNQTADEVMAE